MLESKEDPSIFEKSGKCSIEAAEEGSHSMPHDGLRDETLPGKQEQHRKGATVLSQPHGLGYVL